jgi:hypothetical protein
MFGRQQGDSAQCPRSSRAHAFFDKLGWWNEIVEDLE